MGNSCQKVVVMLKRMKARFEKEPDSKKLYFEFIEEHISRGHMIPITRGHPLFNPYKESFFLLHHEVLKPTNSTTKLRTVFNGSSKTYRHILIKKFNRLNIIDIKIIKVLCKIRNLFK